MSITKNEAQHRLKRLIGDLQLLVDRDPEQEVTGPALSIMDASLSAAREHLDADDPLAVASRDLISPEQVEDGDPIRAADALLVAGQIFAAIGGGRSTARINSIR